MYELRHTRLASQYCAHMAALWQVICIRRSVQLCMAVQCMVFACFSSETAFYLSAAHQASFPVMAQYHLETMLRHR